MKIILYIFLLFPLYSIGQDFNLQKLLAKISFINDSLEKMKNNGDIKNLMYNDTIEVKVVQLKIDNISCFKIVGNWSTNKYDVNFIFVNEGNNILALPIYDTKHYNKVFTFDILAPNFIPKYKIVSENYQIKLITYYDPINMFYKLDNYYVSSKYSINNQFYFNRSKLYKEIEKGYVHPLDNITILKDTYVKNFLHYW